jgi:hypothetical protein
MKEAKRICRRTKRGCDMAILESTEAKTHGVQKFYKINKYTVYSQLSGVKASRILMKPTKLSKKIYHCYKVTMLILICSSATQQWFSQPPLPMLSIVFPNAGVIIIGAS